MSDYRVIAAATATLQNLLAAAIREAVPGASVATGVPPAREGQDFSEGLINVFLYKLEPNPTWRNEELPYRRADGTLIRRPQLAINLFYLLSFYGDDSKHIPTLLVGAALSALHAEPYPHQRHVPQELTAADRRALTGDVGPDLAGTGLLTQHHPLSFTMLSGDEDEVIHTWTQLMHTPYVLSTAYIGRVVLIEPALVPEAALPARRIVVTSSVAGLPRLEAVEPASLPYSPAAELRLVGSNLDADLVEIAVGELTAEPTARSAGELRFLLPEGLPAGILPLRVIHGNRQADGEIRWDRASNPVAAVLQPVVLDVNAQSAPVADAAAEEGSEPLTLLQVRFAPAVRAVTDVELLLNLAPTPAKPRRGYVFRGTTDPSRPDLLEIEAAVDPGRYLLRIRLGGVESPLEVDQDPASPTYERFVGPAVEVT